jgi:rhodanese-related sulfurtransferase
MDTPDPRLAEYKEQLFDQFGRLGRALASPRRLELLDLLCQADRTVEDLARETAMSVSNVSQHLRVLKQAHLVAARKEGLFVHYRLADPAVSQFWRTFRNVAMRCMADARDVVSTYLKDAPGLEPVGLVALRERILSGDAVVLDVRPEAEFRAGHIPGARSIPFRELADRLNEIPPGREVIVYCRGPYCAMAHEAVRLLLQQGFRARRTEDGLPEWRDLGWPVLTGTR